MSKHALSINGKREHFSVEDFMVVARLINCRKPEMIISEVREGVARWAEFAAAAGVREEMVRKIGESILIDVDL